MLNESLDVDGLVDLCRIAQVGTQHDGGAARDHDHLACSFVLAVVLIFVFMSFTFA
jgi:hypothetical protein